MRRILFVIVTMLAVLWPVGAAVAATTLDDVAAALQSDPVYNDPEAEFRLTDTQVEDLTTQIESGSKDMYIAVLPEAAKGDNPPEDVLAYLQEQVGQPGDYAIVVGAQFRATSSAAATEAYRSQRSNGPYAVLSQYVTNVQSGMTGTADSKPESDGSTLFPIVVFGGIAAIAAGLALRSRSRRQKQIAAQVAAVRAALDDDITAYGESLDRVDSAAITAAEDTADWMTALDQYDRAKRAAAGMRTPGDAAQVTESLEEGRFRVACVEARLAGQETPERRAPCFFDPRHGMSVTDVPFTPGSGSSREVPACAACKARIMDGVDPDYRLVPVGSGHQPYWNAGPEYGPWARGYYGTSDIFSTMLVGTMLGSMMTGGFGGSYAAGYQDGAQDVGGNDLGGGDFGGFGGGDFGGGDFGGGW